MISDFKYLWKIYIPVGMFTENDYIEYMVSYHHEWDKIVGSIAGGLTVNKGAIGYWLNFKEKMIPVEVYCTEKQIQEISDITAAHYKQKAIMFFKISSEVHIRTYD